MSPIKTPERCHGKPCVLLSCRYQTRMTLLNIAENAQCPSDKGTFHDHLPLPGGECAKNCWVMLQNRTKSPILTWLLSFPDPSPNQHQHNVPEMAQSTECHPATLQDPNDLMPGSQRQQQIPLQVQCPCSDELFWQHKRDRIKRKVRQVDLLLLYK